MEILITRWHWLQLTNEQRAVMRGAFNIPRSGGVQTENGKLISDGSNEKDLTAINIASMQEYTKSTSTKFDELFNLTLEMVNKTITELEEERKRKEQEVLNMKRTEEISAVVASLLDTYENLPLDAKAKIKVAIGIVPKEENPTIINNTEETHVKKAIRTKKVEKSSN